MTSGSAAAAQEIAEETAAADEAAVTAEFIEFLKQASERRYPGGAGGTMRRFNQPRHTGCVAGEFSISESVPEELRVGLFAQPHIYAAWVRFANASSQTDREKDFRGMSIKLLNVDGGNLTDGSTDQDFVLNSHPVLPASDTPDFLALLRAMEGGGFGRAWFFLTHPRSAFVGLAGRQNHTSHLEIPYWSTTPYLFGPGKAVKYSSRPCSEPTSVLPDELTDDYLLQAMKERLRRSDACFDFMVQFQTDARLMPIEDAIEEWDEEHSPFLKVAELRIPKQEFDTPARMEFCENVALNPWNSRPEHRPLGGLNRARKAIYAELARFRHERNDVVPPVEAIEEGETKPTIEPERRR